MRSRFYICIGLFFLLFVGHLNAQTILGSSIKIIDVKDYGSVGNATGDGIVLINKATDDSAAINRALDAFRSVLATGAAAAIKFPIGSYLAKGSLNFTGINTPLATVDMRGASILCATPGNCIDASGSSHITWLGLSAYGSQVPGLTPAYIFQSARTLGHVAGGPNACGNMLFEGGSLAGWASQATFLSGACETNQYVGMTIHNDALLQDCHAFRNDGNNHYNWQSQFVTINVPPGQYSLEDTTMVGVTMLSQCYPSTGDLGVMWSEGTGHTNIIGGYFLASSAPLVPGGTPVGPTSEFQLRDDGTGGNAMFEVNQHNEGGSQLKYVFVQEGTNAAPVLQINYKTDSGQASVAIIHAEASVTSPVIYGKVRVTDSGGVAVPVFDQNIWNARVDIDVPSSAFWSVVPSTFVGRVCVASACSDSLTDLTIAGAPAFSGGAASSAMTIAPSSGTFTSATATLRSKKLQPRFVYYETEASLTDIGSGTGQIMLGGFTYLAQGICTLQGRENGGINGKMLYIFINGSNGLVFYADGSIPMATGVIISARGVCETSN